MTKHIVVQRRLHRFAYLIIRIILCYQLWFTHAILSLYFSSVSPAPQLNTGIIALAETTSEAYSQYQKFLPCEGDHSLNVMTGFYCVWNNIFPIYVTLQMILNVLWAELNYSSLYNAKLPYDFTIKFSNKIDQTWVDVMTAADL